MARKSISGPVIVSPAATLWPQTFQYGPTLLPTRARGVVDLDALGVAEEPH